MGLRKGDRIGRKVEKEGGYAALIELQDDSEDGMIIHGVDIRQFNLTNCEAQFIIEYMNNGMNGPVAAAKVYGYKDKGAAAKATALINGGRVYPVLQTLIKHSVSKQLQFSPALLMTSIQTWLQYDIRQYYNNDGSAIPLDDIGEDFRQLISGVDYTINNRTGERLVSYKLPDKYKALQELSSIVKFLQSIQQGSPEDDSEAAVKRDQIFGTVSNYRPVQGEE